MVKQNIWKAYQDMILTIIEDKPRYDISMIVFKGILLISFSQILIYLFSDFRLINADEFKLQSVFAITEMTSIINILNLKESDTISYLFYIIAQSIMVLYFIYVGFLAFCKDHMKEFYQQFSNLFVKINEMLNLYFTFYLNVFLSIYLELNFSLLFCSKKSMLSNMRRQYYDPTILTCTIPSYQVAIGVIGIILTLITALITNYYFRNYEFIEKNILKRKSSVLFFLQIILRITITFIEFQWQTDSTQQAKHIIAQVFGVISILDYFFYLPFTDQEISRFYLKVIAYYQAIVTCSNFFLLGRYMNGQEMFYITILLSLLFQATLEQTLNYKYDRIMQGNWKSEKIIDNLDYYLEQMVLLGQQSPYKEESKVLLMKLYKLHRSGCTIQSCLCHKYVQLNMQMDSEQQFMSMYGSESSQNDQSESFENEINMRLLYKFIDGLFQWMFSQKCINKSTSHFEKLSLKYISFMIKYQNNPVRAYYQLKILQLKNTSFSVYFEMVSKIVGRNIQSEIESNLDDEQGQGGEMILGRDNGASRSKGRNGRKNKKQLRNELTVDVIVEVEYLCQKYILVFLKIIEEKLELWTFLQNGYKSMNDFQKDSLKLMKRISTTRTKFLRQLKKVTKEMPDIENCIQFQKLIQIYFLFIVNDTIKAIMIDQKINELRKRDSLSDHDQLKNTSLLKGEICILEISLSENFGKIVSKKNDKTAQFFGYKEKQDFLKVNYVSELMPDYVGRIHNQLMRNYLQGNSTRAKNRNSTIYSFMKQNNGFIFPIKIHFDFNFSTISNDFRFNGVLLKNQTEQEFIIFHRSGKVAGITKNLAQILYGDQQSLPTGDIVIQRMNALLLFPKIIKKIISHKEQIFNDLQRKILSDSQSIGDSTEQVTAFQKSACTMTTLLEDLKSATRFQANPQKNFRRFLSYLNKKNQLQGFLKYDELDLLDPKCLTILRQFEEQDFGGQSTGRSNLSSDRYGAGKTKTNDNFFGMINQNIKTITTQGTKVSSSSVEYKMKYDYTIQYCLLDQREKKMNKSNIKTDKTYSNAYQKNKVKNSKKKDKMQDIYFSICFENIQLSSHQKKVKSKRNTNIFTNIYSYLRSTTSIIPLAQNIEKFTFLKHSYSSQMDTYEDVQFDSQQNQKISNMSTQIMENLAPPLSTSVLEEWVNMPKKMIEALQYSFFNSGVFEEENQNVKHKRRDNDEFDDEEYQNKMLYSSSNKTSNSGTESEQSEDDINYDKLHAQILNQVYTNKDSKEAQDAQFPQLEQTVNNYCYQKNVLNSLDPNYPVKKILQNRSLSSAFGKALEIAISEALIQLEQEKRLVKNVNYQNSDQQNIKPIQYYKLNKDDIVQPITFRQGIENLALNTSLDQQNPSHINLQFDSSLNPDNLLKAHKYVSNQNNVDPGLDVSQISDINNLPQELDISNRASFLAIEQSNALGTSFLSHVPIQSGKRMIQEENKNKNYLNISARPMLDQSSTNVYDVENIRLNTPSIIDAVDHQQSQAKVQINKYQNQKQQSIQTAKQYSLNEQSHLSQFLNVNQSNKKIESDLKISHSQLSLQVQGNSHLDKTPDQYISIRNSSDKNEIQDNDNTQDLINDQVIAKILNQKGLLNGKNTIQKGSVHSSSRSSSSYAGIFLKEIIMRCKIPSAAQKYKLILIIFLFTFLGLTITNLMIIQSDMKIFSDNVIILRQPRKFLRAYGKALFGYYLQIQLQMGFLIDTSDREYLGYSQDYIQKGADEYSSLCEAYSSSLINLGEQQLGNDLNITKQYSIFKFRQREFLNIKKTLMYSQNQYSMISIQEKNQQSQRIDSFLYLRQNYFDFSQDVRDQVTYLVDNTISAVDSLILKFTIVIIAAIFGIISIAIISLPVIRNVNLYEEKIMMIISRINYEQSEIEKTKLAICKQLINIDMIDWLNYSYFDIFSLTSINKENPNISQQSKNQLGQNNLLQSMREKSKLKKVNVGKPNAQLEQSSIMNLNKQEQDPNATQDHFFGQSKIESKLQDDDHYNIKINNQKELRLSQKINGAKKRLKNEGILNSSNNTNNNNYLLQSKIIAQTLRIFDRFLPLFCLTSLNCIYFLVIIIYLTQSNDQLKVPVQMNQRSINLHIIQTNLKISTSLISFDQYIQDDLWPDYSTEDLQSFYSIINQSLEQIKQISNENTQIIYGVNPFPESTVQQLKDIQEGRGCQYIQNYKCSPGEELGLKLINSNKEKFINGYPDIINPLKSDEYLLRQFLNGQSYINELVKSFRQEDEIYDIYSSSINGSISTVSLQIQYFLEDYLIIGGVIFSIFILFCEILNWRSIFARIQLMNLFLTVIPEEKLQEDVTLHMIRQLHRM